MSLGTGIRLADLIAAVCFILALSGLTSPKTARDGNLIGAGGMALAIGDHVRHQRADSLPAHRRRDGDRRRHRPSRPRAS